MHLALYLKRRPALKAQAVRLLACFPPLRHRVSQFLEHAFSVDAAATGVNPEHLSPRARQLYESLKAEIYKKQGSS